MKDRTVIAKGKSLPKEEVAKLRKKSGMSNVGKYKNVSAKNFAGPDGTFPINSIARGKNALARAHYAGNPAVIRAKVYAKYPKLKERHEEREKGSKAKKEK